MLSEIDTRPFRPCRLPSIWPGMSWRGRAICDKPALVLLHPERDETISYARCAPCARHGDRLLGQGLQPGDRILLRLGNTRPSRWPSWRHLGRAGPGPDLRRPDGPRSPAAALSPPAGRRRPGIALPDGADPHPPDLAPGKPCHRTAHLGDPDREAYVIFTSGTSGRRWRSATPTAPSWPGIPCIRAWEG
jgi:hypothetical protein